MTRLYRLFPPGKSGGLIEAGFQLTIAMPSFITFPPGKSGGLIEARYAMLMTLKMSSV